MNSSQQAAVIPLRAGRVCLITSRNGKRWVVPKGCMEPDKTAGQVALQEAWEEAGLVGVLQPEPIGSYVYEKADTCYHVITFLMQVTEIRENWPESAWRDRCWLHLSQACARVAEPGLRQLLQQVATADPVSLPA